jgi:hypothetical protein
MNGHRQGDTRGAPEGRQRTTGRERQEGARQEPRRRRKSIINRSSIGRQSVGKVDGKRTVRGRQKEGIKAVPKEHQMGTVAPGYSA